MILLIDNYDSFVFNLVQTLGALDPTLDLRVKRNDQITCEQIADLGPRAIIISPGPCTPDQAGVSNDVIRSFAGHIPILGVCLGHQCIGACFSMTVTRNHRLVHGKTSTIHHDGRGLFKSLPNPLVAARYHSLAIDPPTFDHQRFEVTAWTDQGEIMGLRAKSSFLTELKKGDAATIAPLEGVQFHPESFLTANGPQLLANFLKW